jgi:transposase
MEADGVKTMTSREVSEYLGISLNTLQKWRSRGIGPEFYKYGGANSAAIRYDRQSVISFREQHTAPQLHGQLKEQV